MQWPIHRLQDYIKISHFIKKASDYKPQKISRSGVAKWLNQFDKNDHRLILSLFDYIHYYSEQKTEDILVKQNTRLLDKLQKNGIKLENIIYVTIDKPASSSHLMLNIIRDKCNLEKRGVKIIDCQNVLELIKATSSLGSGAIIYVDDFAGTGKQFSESRDLIAEQVPLISSQFSEFFLLPCICREALIKIQKKDVEVYCNCIHDVNDRPLHADCSILSEDDKSKLVNYCREIDNRSPLGYEGIAAMVIFYRNAPNNVPVIFRGNVGQDRKVGIFPRSTDLNRR
jgi:hypothetical protein